MKNSFRRALTLLLTVVIAVTSFNISAFAAGKLPAPENIKVYSGSTNATVKWDKVDGADAYKVMILDEAANKYVTYKNVTGSSCTLKDLDPAKEYKIKVASCVKTNGKLVKQSTSKAKTVKTAQEPKTLVFSGVEHLVVGDSITISAVVTPSGYENVKWSSSDPSVISISASGTSCKLTALKVGSSRITAKAGSAQKSATIEVTKEKAKTLKKDPGFSVKIYDSGKADFIFENVKSIKKDSGDYYSVHFESDYSKYSIELCAFKGTEIRCDLGILEETLGGQSDVGAECYIGVLKLDYRFENGKLIISVDLNKMKFMSGMKDMKKHIKIDFKEITNFNIARNTGNTFFSKNYSADKVVVK